VGGADGKDFQHESIKISVIVFKLLVDAQNVNFYYLEKCETCLKDLFTHILEHFTVIALSELCCKRAKVYTSGFT